MARTSSYYLYERYEKRGDQDWIPSYPNTYSKDGDGTMPLVVRVARDEACGWHCDPEYQWVDVPISEDYVCDECDIDIDFRWVSTSAYTYIGDYKYEILQEQFRKDNGEWIDTENTKLGNPVKVGKKIKITFDNGVVFSQSCGSDDGVWHSYIDCNYKLYSESAVQYITNTKEDGIPVIDNSSELSCAIADRIEFGDCVYEIGWRYRNSSNGCGKSYWDNDVSESGERMRNVCIGGVPVAAKEIVFPETLRWIGGFNTTKVTALTIPSSVESIGYLRSFDQSSPTSSCISSLYSRAFYGSKSLRNLTLNEGLKSIGSMDFSYCTSLERVDLPASLEKIGPYLFSGCTNLKQIVFKGETPPTLICDDDSQYYGSQCRGEWSHPNLSANSETYIYVPCGSKSAYTHFIDDFPEEKIIEYGGNCGNIPNISDMYRVLFSYKVGNDTTNVYRTLSSQTHTLTATTTDFNDVIDNDLIYPDEIIIPVGTDLHTGEYQFPTIVPYCKRLTIYGTVLTNSVQAVATWVTTYAEEVVISTDMPICFLGGSCNLKKVTVTSGYSPSILSCFPGELTLEELHFDGNPFIGWVGGHTPFIDCANLKDIYITNTDSVIEVHSDADHPVLRGSSPTVHVPCELYNAYKISNFWGSFNIVKNDDSCD